MSSVDPMDVVLWGPLAGLEVVDKVWQKDIATSCNRCFCSWLYFCSCWSIYKSINSVVVVVVGFFAVVVIVLKRLHCCCSSMRWFPLHWVTLFITWFSGSCFGWLCGCNGCESFCSSWLLWLVLVVIAIAKSQLWWLTCYSCLYNSFWAIDIVQQEVGFLRLVVFTVVGMLVPLL